MYPFGNPTIPFEWIKKIPSEDRLWARTYLVNENLHPAYHAFDPGGPGFGNADDPNHLKIDLRLRNAWRQRKARKRQTEKIACNFNLKKLSKRQLEKIAEEQHSTITETLESLINGETEKLKESKEKLKSAKQASALIEERYRRELLRATEALEARGQVLQATEAALHLQTMKLVVAELQIEKPEAQGITLGDLKNEALQRFSKAWGRTKGDIGLFQLGLIVQLPDPLQLWSRITSDAADAPTS